MRSFLCSQPPWRPLANAGPSRMCIKTAFAVYQPYRYVQQNGERRHIPCRALVICDLGRTTLPTNGSTYVLADTQSKNPSQDLVLQLRESTILRACLPYPYHRAFSAPTALAPSARCIPAQGFCGLGHFAVSLIRCPEPSWATARRKKSVWPIASRTLSRIE